jgi:hypothetical protein
VTIEAELVESIEPLTDTIESYESIGTSSGNTILILQSSSTGRSSSIVK